jgi:hypothetical protein
MSDQLTQRRRGYVDGLHRRRAHADTSRFLSCGQCTDTWTCRCYDGPVTDKHAEAAVAAIQHLDVAGTPGLLDEDTCRAMWRIGFRDLAVEVYNRSQGLVA